MKNVLLLIAILVSPLAQASVTKCGQVSASSAGYQLLTHTGEGFQLAAGNEEVNQLLAKAVEQQIPYCISGREENGGSTIDVESADPQFHHFPIVSGFGGQQ